MLNTRLIYFIILIFVICIQFNCGHKKKKSLFWALALMGNSESGKSTITSGGSPGGNTSSSSPTNGTNSTSGSQQLAPPSNLSYGISELYLLAPTTISNLIPTVSGSQITYSINPALPNGLSINSATGVISGNLSSSVNGGSYTVTAANSAGSANFTFTIVVYQSAISEVEPNDSYLTCSNLPSSGSVIIATGAIDTIGNSDYYSIVINPEESPINNLKIETFENNNFSCPTISTALTLYNTNGTTIMQSDTNSGPGNCSMITQQSLSAGTYFIKVNKNGNNAIINSYILRITKN